LLHSSIPFPCEPVPSRPSFPEAKLPSFVLLASCIPLSPPDFVALEYFPNVAFISFLFFSPHSYLNPQFGSLRSPPPRCLPPYNSPYFFGSFRPRVRPSVFFRILLISSFYSVCDALSPRLRSNHAVAPYKRLFIGDKSSGSLLFGLYPVPR